MKRAAMLAGVASVCVACGGAWEVERSVTIDAPPSAVWSVLADLAAYEEWNRYSPGADGTLEEGGVVTITAKLGDEVQTVDNRVTRVEPERVLCWHSMNWFEPLVKGTRCRFLTPNGDGGTEFRHHEIMEGAAAGIVEAVYRERIEAGLELMNGDLKRAAEARSR